MRLISAGRLERMCDLNVITCFNSNLPVILDKTMTFTGLKSRLKSVVGLNRSDIRCTMGSQGMQARRTVQPERSAYSGRMATTRGGFTLIEVLLVIGIIAVLAALLIPAVGLVRTRAKITETKQTLREVQTAFDLYRNEDRKHSYPTVAADLSIGTALMDHLEHQRMWARGFRKADEQGRLLDPWQGWYRYSLVKPAPATGSPALTAWNWDAALGRERAYGSRLDPANPGVPSAGPLPYAYLWSLGRTGRTDDAEDWLLCEDGR